MTSGTGYRSTTANLTALEIVTSIFSPNRLIGKASIVAIVAATTRMMIHEIESIPSARMDKKTALAVSAVRRII
jgi:hypothetical protein